MMQVSKPPIISVVMSIYNEPEKWLRESIESILNQTFVNFEFIIINDNPDRELNNLLLNEYKANDIRIIIINNDKNIGLTKSLNIGLKLTKGKYIARMDADDISLSKRLQIQLDLLNSHPNIGVCGTGVKIMGLKSLFLRRRLYYPISSNQIRTEIIFKNPMAHPTIMLRKELIFKNNLFYNEKLNSAQDYELWSRIIIFKNFHNINKCLLKYRLSPNQISNKFNKKQIVISNNIRLNILKKIFNAKEEEIYLHNKICNHYILDNLNELNDLELWFKKMLATPIDEKLYEINHLKFKLNILLQEAYINYYTSVKSLNYFKTELYKHTNYKFFHFFYFIHRYFIKCLK
jgi:glycosyltransferase involved in cell wall biosynthesis